MLVGREIVEEEQRGNRRAGYGERPLTDWRRVKSRALNPETR